MTNTNLFTRDAVFISDERSKKKLFKNLYQDLLDGGYVKGDFFEHIYQREVDFPTGLSLATLGKDLPNIALPHTEGQFVKKSLIVPVKLETPLEFGEMINPKQQLPVNFLFMLMETDPNGQAQLLSQVMNFLANTPEEELDNFFKLEDTDEIYQFLVDNFA